MNSLISVHNHSMKLQNVPLTITLTGTLVGAYGTTNFPNTANYKYFFISSGSGTVSLNKSITCQVVAAGGGGGGGGNSYNHSTDNYGPGAGGGGGGSYYNTVTLTTATITLAIGPGGAGGAGGAGGGNGSPGTAGTQTTFSGNALPSVTLNGGGYGYGANGSTQAVAGGGGSGYTANGAAGGIGGATGAGHYGPSITIGDMAAATYCGGASGGNYQGASPNGTYTYGLIGDGGSGANAPTAGVRSGSTGTNGCMLLVIPINA